MEEAEKMKSEEGIKRKRKRSRRKDGIGKKKEGVREERGRRNEG